MVTQGTGVVSVNHFTGSTEVCSVAVGYCGAGNTHLIRRIVPECAMFIIPFSSRRAGEVWEGGLQ